MTEAAAADALSSELLASILERVEQQERLTSCALVCEAWAVAAAAGTRRISFYSFKEEGHVAGLNAWLRQHGSNISSLEVSGLPPASFYSSISSLAQLQDLSMEGLLADGDAAPLFSLPDLSSLTRLSIENGGHHLQLPQRFLNLPKLEMLELEGVLFNPCILDSMTQLQDLVSGIGQLTQLTALWLRLYWDRTDPPQAPCHAFSALTASSKLEFLHVKFNSETDLDGNYAVMPGRNVLQHMFPSGRQLPQLESLGLGCAENWYSNWRVPAADLGRIASSCLRLRSFGWYHLLDPATAADLSPLLRLTSLSSLRLGGDGVGSTAAPIVAQLTQLTSLEWGSVLVTTSTARPWRSSQS